MSTVARPPRRMVALSLIGFLALAVSGCGLPGLSGTNSETPRVTYVTSEAPEGPTPTIDPRSPLTIELGKLQTAFDNGQTSVTLDGSTFPPGSEVVLLTHGSAGNSSVEFEFRTSANGPLRDERIPQYFSIGDWRYRSNPGPPVIVADGANMIPLMASVYENFDNQRMSLAQAEQEINAGRPVGIERLTAHLIFVQDMVIGHNTDGTLQTMPINQISFMFSSADFTPKAINLG